jgi:hypothetical protein
LPQDEAHGDKYTDHQGGKDLCRIPGVFAATPSHTYNENGHAGEREEDAPEIDSLQLSAAVSLGLIMTLQITHNLQSPWTFFNGMKKMAQPVVRAVRGRLRRKIHRHDSADLDDKAPPTTGPIPFAMATTAPYGQ